MFPLLITLIAHPALAMERAPSGTVEVVLNGAVTHLPMVRTEVNADIHGDLATVRLTQTFANPSEELINATYAFPLPEDAAVHAMTLMAGDVIIQAEIAEKHAAQAKFVKAQSEGKQAALLTQHRPNVFTQQVANLPPGAEIRVEVAYVHAIPKNDGAFEWVLPVAVGPRYVPGQRWHPGEPEPTEMGTWTVPHPADLTLPATIEAGRLAVSVTLDGGVAIPTLESPSHTMRLSGKGRFRTAALSGEVDNEDLVLRYTLADEELAAGVTTFAQDGRGVVSVLIDPPVSVDASRLTPREMVFVLDTSGSMRGQPMDTVKRFVHRSLDSLRPGDHFRLVRFGNNASEFGAGAVPANEETLQQGHAWIDAIAAGGGTEMRTGINAALDAPQLDGAVRTVVFLTDGYIGNDADVIRLLRSKGSDSRLFALGVGGSVNRWLLEEMARVGRGTARVVTDPTRAVEQADALADRMTSPYLTDLRIDWGDAPIRDVSPAVLPDVFLGDPLRVMGRFEGPGTFTVTVHGKIAGADATLPLRIELPEQAKMAKSLPLTWARWQVEDRMHRYQSPLTDSTQRREIEQQVTALGLEYGLATQWTSFVAVVPEQPQLAMNTPTHSAPNHVPSNHASWGGNAAPEPAGWAAMGLLALMGAAAGRRRRRRQSLA